MSAAGQQGHRAAIIDDSDVVLGMMEMLLVDEGWSVQKFGSAFGIDGALKEFRPHLVLLDLGMRGMSEAMLPMRIRDFQAMGAKVLLHSGRGDKELRALADRIGANGHLAKTGDIDHILQVLSRHLD